jgi:exonuclease SbcC
MAEVGMFQFNLYSTLSVAKFDRKICTITGPTGSGKTSILDAATFALYGATTRTDRSMKLEDIIRPGGYTYVIFTKGGHEYYVKRGRKKNGQSYMELRIDGKTAMEGLITPITGEVVRIVGMDYEAFTASSIIRQDEMKLFLMKRTSERLKSLQGLFGLNVFEKAWEAAKGERDTIAARINVVKAENEGIKRSTANEANVKETMKNRLIEIREKESTKKAIDEETAVENTAMATLRKQKEGESGAAATIASASASIDELESRKASIEAEIGQLRGDIATKRASIPSASAAKQTREAAKRSDALKNEIALATKELESRESMANEQKEKLSAIAGKYKNGITIDEFSDMATKLGAVEVRANELHDPTSAIILPKLKKELYSAKKRCVAGVVSDVLAKEMRIDPEMSSEAAGKIEAMKGEAGELDVVTGGKSAVDVERDIAEIAQAESEANHLESTLQDKASQVEEIAASVVEKCKEIEALKQTSGDSSASAAISEKEGTIAGLMERSGQLASEIGEARGVFNSARAQLDQINVIKQKMEQNAAEISGLEKDKELISIIADKILKPSGVPKYAVSTIMAIVAVRASEILNGMSDGQMNTVEFDTFEEGRSYGIEIYVDKKLASSFSGGERTQINAAIRLAIAETISEMSVLGAKMRTLFIDEGDMGSLDKDNSLPKFLETISRLNYYSKIIVISHIDGVPESLGGKSIMVEKVAGHSRIVS